MNVSAGPVCGSCEKPIWRQTGKCERLACEVGVENYRARRARETRARDRRAAVRRPPRPPYERQPNTCALCGLRPLPGRRRSWCSDDCVLLWRMATSPSEAFGMLTAFYPGCWECGALTYRVDVDHVRPLWSLTDQERTELRWWLPFNLQLLCHDCHKAKTKREAAQRAGRGEPLDQLELTVP